ncbi:DNA replication complex GINS protein PSF1 [Selaginella moellendorffii]|uniref:DNA replication complex GINS protein PSF1 n=1 Tax=Selaginella moellendorffii TaxID=88036 RepID=UPI000D1C5AF0|nr:DNA replication complex GINS protein PSF1 [Selaginella moellendorffii]|eukprot:XP_002982392.2 DNA replication complex GINS protein PSF1 [Selaginella moellendorffii]
MFGRKGAQLCVELLHTEEDQLSRFNNDLFEQVLNETSEHFEQLEARLTKMHEEGLDAQTTKNADFYGGLTHHTSILRNKRCLLAYIYHRAQTVQRLRWQLGAVLPDDIQSKLSYSENNYFKQYSDSLGVYMSSIDLDLSVDLSPPKDPYIQVKVLENVGNVYLDDQSTSLLRNSIHLIKRSEAEPLISQGLLEEFID